MIPTRKASPERSARRSFLKKKWAKAIEEYQKCLAEDDSNLPVVNLIGDAHYRKKDAEEAFEHYRQVLEAYEAEGLYDNAIAMAKKILRIEPEETGMHLKLAQLYTDQSFLADALNHLKTYVKSAGKHLDERALRSIYQKMAGIPNENPNLWDEIAKSYQNLDINDPELDRIMTPGSAATESTPAFPDDKSPHNPASENSPVKTDKSEIPIYEIKEPEDTAHQETEPTPPDTEREESTTADDIVAEPTATNVSEPTDSNINTETPSASADTSEDIKTPIEAQPDQDESPPDALKLESILQQVLPPEEVPEAVTPIDNTQIPEAQTTEPEPKPEPTAPPQPKSEPKSAQQTQQIESTIEPEPDATVEPEIHSQANPDNEPQPELTEQELDIPAPPIDEETDQQDTIQQIPDDDKGEEETLWTIPFDVAQESTPETDQQEQTATEEISEHQAVEEMLTGFSADKPKQEETVEGESLPTLPEIQPPTDKAATKEPEPTTELTEPSPVKAEEAPVEPPAPTQDETEVTSAEPEPPPQNIPEVPQPKPPEPDEIETPETQEPESVPSSDETDESTPALTREEQPTKESTPEEVESAKSETETDEIAPPKEETQKPEPAPSQEEHDSKQLKEDLQSLELSELAELNQEQTRFTPSFDGKEHFDMGKIYKEMSLWDAAIAEFKTSAMDPNWRAKSCILLAECFKQKGEIALAISQLKWALSSEEEMKEDEDKYNIHFELGFLYETAGEYSEAREQYQTVHRWKPAHRGVEGRLLELRKKMQSG
jgi:tetratricopeptide (TPR) repeat protein